MIYTTFIDLDAFNYFANAAHVLNQNYSDFNGENLIKWKWLNATYLFGVIYDFDGWAHPHPKNDIKVSLSETVAISTVLPGHLDDVTYLIRIFSAFFILKGTFCWQSSIKVGWVCLSLLLLNYWRPQLRECSLRSSLLRSSIDLFIVYKWDPLLNLGPLGLQATDLDGCACHIYISWGSRGNVFIVSNRVLLRIFYLGRFYRHFKQ